MRKRFEDILGEWNGEPRAREGYLAFSYDNMASDADVGRNACLKRWRLTGGGP